MEDIADRVNKFLSELSEAWSETNGTHPHSAAWRDDGMLVLSDYRDHPREILTIQDAQKVIVQFQANRKEILIRNLQAAQRVYDAELEKLKNQINSLVIDSKMTKERVNVLNTTLGRLWGQVASNKKERDALQVKIDAVQQS